MSTDDETRCDTGIIGPDEERDATLTFPAIGAAPRPPAIACGECGEMFAQAAFGGRGLFLAETLHAAAVNAGWSEAPEGTWTCTVCQAKAAAPAEPEAAPVAPEPEAAPVADPLDQSIAILAEFDAKVPGMWTEVNRSNGTANHKTYLRINDAHHNFLAIFGRTPELQSDLEAAEGLRRFREDLKRQRDEMHQASEERLAKLREQPAGTEVAA